MFIYRNYHDNLDRWEEYLGNLECMSITNRGIERYHNRKQLVADVSFDNIETAGTCLDSDTDIAVVTAGSF